MATGEDTAYVGGGGGEVGEVEEHNRLVGVEEEGEVVGQLVQHLNRYNYTVVVVEVAVVLVVAEILQEGGGGGGKATGATGTTGAGMAGLLMVADAGSCGATPGSLELHQLEIVSISHVSNHS
ncbi:hypothetical protein CEXT_785401 [Caerostris extrusa]|uniref:Uncharacterized protein n=1 Tax=Caerostris extrusa TaxID=172846 RepID=A0AAV4NTV7_CAEEX|nr:hypothetical protein CEXT_785401 [Caerostris extrusa]